ncbi:MAG: 30S ribosomal protein S1 [Gammaproteobacteria bacterium]|nr:30S ribosomal protein S1 [Gammaproteobacteria bacterium]
MTQNFAELFQEHSSNFTSGSTVMGEVLEVAPDYVVVDAGLKTESYIDSGEFKNREGDLEVVVGDSVELVIEAMDDGAGRSRLSREKAKRQQVWKKLELASQNNELVIGVITERVRGGFTVEIEQVIKAFLPGSQIDVKPVRDPSYLLGKDLEFKLVKLDSARNNIVVSRRAVIADNAVGQQEVLENIQEGQEVVGVVKNLTEYGAFVDLGGVDGLLHITDMSWKRIKHPSELINIGDEIKVKVLKIDHESGRISLGIKQLSGDPWQDIARRYPVGTRVFGKVTNLTEYGCFVEIENGIEGLVHMSEMDWTNKNVHPSKIVNSGDEVEVMILEIDEDRRRISLGLKQCKSNPWLEFAENHKKGDLVKGPVKSITDFGIFIGLDGGIDGLVHLSDLSWVDSGDRAVRDYKRGQEVEATILAIDADKERISLGVKQLDEDVYSDYLATHPKGTSVQGTVTSVDQKVVTIDLGNDIIGKLRAADISVTRINDATDVFEVGDSVEAKVQGLDRKTRAVLLSRKDIEKEQQAAVEMPLNTQLSEQLREHMDKE